MDGPRRTDYVDAIAPERRPLTDRIHRLILELHPDTEVVHSYQMPTSVIGRYRRHVELLKQLPSFYGWEQPRRRLRRPPRRSPHEQRTITRPPDDAASV